ncbi:hypothetical protein KKD62_00160 [Patescibacteria group bacterium]|nr:hypothetical protein [Patescibacteria group bacterium]MBU1931884.1 hypothetical protein [Patescibacteria group bacterium]
MFPSRTSLIPVQIALARFLETNGWGAVFKNYPYWYLGTTPFRYLTGPIFPGLLVMVHKILPNISLFEAVFLVLGLVWPLGAVGVYLLLRQLGGKKSLALIAALLYFFGPLTVWLFSFSDGLSLIGSLTLPFVLYIYLRWLKQPSRTNITFCIISICFAILLNSLMVPSLFLGMAAVLLATTSWKKIEKKIKSSLLIIIYCLLITSLWYAPGYWWQVIIAPSFAGKSLFQVISQLGQLLPIVLALSLAIVSSKSKNINHKTPVIKFTFYWLFIFGFLTLMRFIADPDFWLDWLAYGWELQLGLAVAIGLWVSRCWNSPSQAVSPRISFKLVLAGTAYCLLFTVIFKTRIIDRFQQDITRSVEYRISYQLSKLMKPDERVFLSGSSVFWLNAFFDISQVRGGNDRASVDPDWRAAAWEIREGQEVNKTIKALEDLGVSWLVVHTPASLELYHDFKYPEKFEDVGGLEKVYDQSGDRIYRVLP